MKKGVIAVAASLMLAGLAHAEGNKYYALVEKVDGKWELKKIGTEKPVWEKKTQEILEINKETGTSFFPSYEETGEWQYLGQYSYKTFSDEPASLSNVTYSCKLRSDSTKYTPCNSSLTSFINTDFFGLLGNSRYSFRRERLERIVEEANLPAEVTACREKNLGYAQDALRTFLALEPSITDASGYYDNSKLYDVVPVNYDCTIPSTNEISYVLKNFSPVYNVEIDQKEFSICKDGAKCKVAPNVKILSKNIKGLNINDTFADDYISVVIDKINGAGSSVDMKYAIRNKSKNSIDVESVSLYIDDDIMKEFHKSKQELEPKQVIEADHFNASQVRDRVLKKVNFPISVQNQNNKLTVGVAVKYTVDGVPKTMFESKEYSLKKVAQDI